MPLHGAHPTCFALSKFTTSDSLPCIQRRKNEQPKKSKKRSTESPATAHRCDYTHLHDLPAAKLSHMRLAPCDELASSDFENTCFFSKERSKETTVSFSAKRGGSRDVRVRFASAAARVYARARVLGAFCLREERVDFCKSGGRCKDVAYVAK